MSVSRSDILDLLEQSVAHGSGLIGGRRRRRVGRPRKRRVRGRGEGEMMSVMSEPHLEMMVREVIDEKLHGDGVIGRGLIGGVRRSRPKKKMSEATKRYLAEYHKLHPRRRKRGGASSAQELYDAFLAEADLRGDENPEEFAQREIEKRKDFLKLGIVPETRKSGLIKRINTLEKKLGMSPSSHAKLNAYTIKHLDAVLKSLKATQDVFKYPPKFTQSALYEGEEDLYFPRIAEEEKTDTGKEEAAFRKAIRASLGLK